MVGGIIGRIWWLTIHMVWGLDWGFFMDFSEFVEMSHHFFIEQNPKPIMIIPEKKKNNFGWIPSRNQTNGGQRSLPRRRKSVGTPRSDKHTPFSLQSVQHLRSTWHEHPKLVVKPRKGTLDIKVRILIIYSGWPADRIVFSSFLPWRICEFQVLEKNRLRIVLYAFLAHSFFCT